MIDEKRSLGSRFVRRLNNVARCIDEDATVV